MPSKREKRMAGNYEITHAVRIGGAEVVLGEDKANTSEPYLCAIYETNGILEQYKDCMVGDHYAELVKLFGQRVQQRADRVLEEQEKTIVPLEPFQEADCFPDNSAKSIKGQIVAVKIEALAPEYRTAPHQLVYVTGGNGALANAHGNACFCINLYTGEHTRWERYDIQGEVRPERIPDWAKHRLAEIKWEQQRTERQRQDKEAR